MRRLRAALADLLVGVVVLLVALWLLRSVIGMVIWGATIVLLVILVVFVLRIAAKIRG